MFLSLRCLLGILLLSSPALSASSSIFAAPLVLCSLLSRYELVFVRRVLERDGTRGCCGVHDRNKLHRLLNRDS